MACSVTRANMRIPVTFWRFALVGVCGLITDATLLEAGVAVGLSTLVARCFSVLLALQVTYALHLHLPFARLNVEA